MWYIVAFEFLNKYKKPLLIALAVVVLYFVVRHYWPSPDPDEGEVKEDNPNTPPTDAEIEKATVLARGMYTNFENYGLWNALFRPMEIFKQFAAESDKVFVLAYNKFNKLYQISGEGSLRQWFQDDAFTSGDWELIETLIFPRMDRLNLT